ncbi:hypothetical protein K504DRAFT_442660 [Pleomassaria siparia CBS 279.74]|uniref:Uncharacterized protein n=1 Tax=Pleomassaria siparia CBS 279.74 TaxID=1314801 RepID=A0A6G1JTG7_9PLEO|nr:hypothetical protein K504DRAFT_442660 [Pleomassaria siparia CBS 279.74]
MAPIRRYLRITKHSVLEVRIYLDRPSDAEAWLLRRDDPALPRVMHAVRPLVLPKLREENERAKGKGSSKAKKRGVKDVVIEGDLGATRILPGPLTLIDEFEVSIFLTDLSFRHSVLTKQKMAKDKPRIQSNSGKLTNWLTAGSSERPMIIAEDTGEREPIIIGEEDDAETVILDNIPEAGGDRHRVTTSSRNKRRRRNSGATAVSDVSDSDDSFRFESAPLTKRARTIEPSPSDADEDDKKKLAMSTSYDGFSIYGRILCLVVKRKGLRNPASGGRELSSQHMLENWVSTQAEGDDNE